MGRACGGRARRARLARRASRLCAVVAALCALVATSPRPAEAAGEARGETPDGAPGPAPTRQGPWPVARAARLIARHHAERPAIETLPRTADALLEHVRRFDPHVAVVPLDAPRAGRLGVLSIEAPDGPVLVPQPGGPAWRAGLVRPIRLGDGAETETGHIVGTRLDTGERVELNVTRGVADEGAAHRYRLGGRTVLALYSFVGGRTVDSARWRLSGAAALAAARPPGVPGAAKAVGAAGPVVLDLRYCAGGDVFEATDLAALWLGGSHSWTTLHEASGPAVALRAGAPRGAAFAVPEAMIVSAYTASACEQLVRGLAHHASVTVIGERTAGKCTVQSAYPLDAAHAIRFTTGRWSGPEDAPCDPRGIAPDRGVTGSVHDDEDVARALRALPGTKGRSGPR